MNQVCAIERLLGEDSNQVSDLIAIAGSLENHGGSAFEYEAKRLKNSESNSDAEKEGLNLVLKGGKNPLSGPLRERKPQKAILEFLCDPEKTGLEGEWSSEDRYEGDDKKLRRREEGDGGNEDEDDGSESGVEHQLLKEDAALIWKSYKEEEGEGVLRLSWHTKYACEKRDGNDDSDDGEKDSSSSWGFFTWFVIM